MKLSEYLSALERHYSAVVDGHWDEDGLPHLASVLSNTAVILDAHECGVLVNDLPQKTGGTPALLRKLEANYTKRKMPKSDRESQKGR